LNSHFADDGQLERLFLRCKKSVERAKEVLEMYYTLRSALPEIFSNTDPAQEWFKKIISVRYLTGNIKCLFSALGYGNRKGSARINFTVPRKHAATEPYLFLHWPEPQAWAALVGYTRMYQKVSGLSR
jgi:hypothetical protein